MGPVLRSRSRTGPIAPALSLAPKDPVRWVQRPSTMVACNREGSKPKYGLRATGLDEALVMSPLGPPCTALSCTHSPRARVVVRVHRHVWPYAPPSVCQGVWTGSAVGGWDRSRADRGSAISALGEVSPHGHAGMLAAAAGCCGVPSAYRMEASVLSTGMLFVRKSDGFSASGMCATLMLPSATRWWRHVERMR